MTELYSGPSNWVLPTQPTTFTSTSPNYEESLPIRVNRDGVTNYIKNRGSLNLGDWAIEGRRRTSDILAHSPADYSNILQAPPPKVLGPEALQNYTRGRRSTPNLIQGVVDAPNPHHNMRVKREGLDNYNRNHHSQMKVLFENYGKLPLASQPLPHTQGDLATNLFYSQQKGRMGILLNNYGNFPLTPRPTPNVKGVGAILNMARAQGDSDILEHAYDRPISTPEPHVNGVQAHLNYTAAQGHSVDKLFHEYGKLPISARTAPKVKYDGVQNFVQAQGDAVRKAISQCPPSNRYIDRPQSVQLWR